MAWDPPKTRRDQLVLFSQRLDEVLPRDHLTGRMVEILDQLDWKVWEATYKHEGPGRAPIHPKVMSGIVLYGLMRGVRSSRRLEEALEMRLDFRWLGEGRSIDHSTLCRFRQSHSDRLKGCSFKSPWSPNRPVSSRLWSWQSTEPRSVLATIAPKRLLSSS